MTLNDHSRDTCLILYSSIGLHPPGLSLIWVFLNVLTFTLNMNLIKRRNVLLLFGEGPIVTAPSIHNFFYNPFLVFFAQFMQIRCYACTIIKPVIIISSYLCSTNIVALICLIYCIFWFLHKLCKLANVHQTCPKSNQFEDFLPHPHPSSKFHWSSPYRTSDIVFTSLSHTDTPHTHTMRRWSLVSSVYIYTGETKKKKSGDKAMDRYNHNFMYGE